MSCNCTISLVTPLLRTLGMMSSAKRDPWVVFAFTATHLVIHFASDDQCMMSTATIPKELFCEFAASTDCRFVVCLSSIISALELCGPYTRPNAPVTLAYPSTEMKCLVEVSNPAHTIRAAITTRPVVDHLLNLHFDRALLLNEFTLRGDLAREFVVDLSAMLPEHVQFGFPSASRGSVCITGLGGPFGTLTVDIAENADGLMRLKITDHAVRPKFLASHTFAAFGGASGPALERVTARINADRQLCVTHSVRDQPDVDVHIEFVVQPLASIFDT